LIHEACIAGATATARRPPHITQTDREDQTPMGNAITLTTDNFEQTVTDNDIVLVDFWASWCGPCRSFAPVFEQTASEHPDIVFGKVDTEDQQQLAAQFGISSIPTLMIFRDQVLLYSQPGALPKHALDDLIGQARNLDMEDVRRQLAERQTS
jgi:thioredoxin 1